MTCSWQQRGRRLTGVAPRPSVAFPCTAVPHANEARQPVKASPTEPSRKTGRSASHAPVTLATWHPGRRSAHPLTRACSVWRDSGVRRELWLCSPQTILRRRHLLAEALTAPSRTNRIQARRHARRDSARPEHRGEEGSPGTRTARDPRRGLGGSEPAATLPASVPFSSERVRSQALVHPPRGRRLRRVTPRSQ